MGEPRSTAGGIGKPPGTTAGPVWLAKRVGAVMPSVIVGGVVNTNCELQNGVFCSGLFNLGGWDSNQKATKGKAETYGFHNVSSQNINVCSDCGEVLDGVILDTDWKTGVGFNG